MPAGNTKKSKENGDQKEVIREKQIIRIKLKENNKTITHS